jgi:hypothetical protein
MYPRLTYALEAQAPTVIFATAASRLRVSIFAAAEAVERLFAYFASVPYENPTSRRQWEELLESSAERRRFQ